MRKLAIVSTHPIQYNAPLFRLLAEGGNTVRVFYTWSQTKTSVQDKVFGREIEWDIPILEGYEYEFVNNIAKNPGSHHFLGIQNPELISRIKRYQPSAILFFGWNFKSHLMAMRYFKNKISVWFRGDSTLIDEKGGIKTFLRRQILKQIYKYVDKAFYVGQANKHYFLKHGLIESQLVYAPHAIDNDRFSEGVDRDYDCEALKWRADLGYTSSDIVILFAGKLEPKKQPDFLIKAFKLARRKASKPLKLLVIGNGPLEEDLMNAKDDDITFLPFQNQTKMPVVYRLGDVYCLPSKGPGETWGLAVNESMVSGTPVIVSDKVGCASDLVDSSVGYVFSYDDINGLVDILTSMTKNELMDLSINSREKIKIFSYLNIVKALEENL